MAVAIGAVAVGAFAIGALAIGRLVIKRMLVRDARLKSLEIEELTVTRLRVSELAVSQWLDRLQRLRYRAANRSQDTKRDRDGHERTRWRLRISKRDSSSLRSLHNF